MADKVNQPKVSLSAEDLRQLGLKAAGMIIEKTLEGEGPDGPFAPYSTNPFAMPLGAITAKAKAALGKTLKVFTSAKGTLWAVITGGYAAYKRAAYGQDGGTVNLSASGLMLQSLTVLEVDPSQNRVVIGFSNPEAAEIAWYHQESGTGKSRVKRKFLGFTEEQKAELAAWAGTRIIITT